MCQSTFTGQDTPSTGDATFAAWFREFSRICEVPATFSAADYTMTMTSTGSSNSHNGLAIRAGIWDSNGVDSTDMVGGVLQQPGFAMDLQSQITISSQQSLPMIGTFATPTDSFFLIQVPPSQAGTALNVQMNDSSAIADPTTIRFVPPATAFGGGAIYGASGSFSGGTVTPPAGSAQPAPGCSVTRPAGNPWSGQQVTFSIPIPMDWSCDMTSQTDGCWIRVQVDHPPSTASQDIVWTMNDSGPPIRLVQ